MCSALYDFCRDQGSIIGGVLALIAGLLLYKGALKQVSAVDVQTKALKQQNADLRQAETQRRARETLGAVCLFSGIIENVIEHGGNKTHITSADVRWQDLPLYEIVDHLGKLNRKSIDAYFSLARKLKDTRTSGIQDVEQLRNQLEEIRKIVTCLNKELIEQSKTAMRILESVTGPQITSPGFLPV